MELRLTYPDSQNQQLREVIADTPIAIGCNITYMPKRVNSQSVFQIVIFHPTIKPYHALITEDNGRLRFTDDRDRPIAFNQDSLNLGQISLSLTGDFELTSAGDSQDIQEDRGNQASNQTNRCQKQVGFLFKRTCDRTTAVGCPHCSDTAGDDLNNSGSYSEYVYYSNYGSYDNDYDTWGYDYYRRRDYYYYDHHHRRVGFTEADNRAFETEGDRDFEQDYSAS